MKPLLLLLIYIISFLSSIAQSNIDGWDKDWGSKVRGKLKSIKVGNRAIGTAIFYYKSNRSIFSIVKRSQHGWDSVSSICANFQNDTLFRVVVTRHLRGSTQGTAIVYLDGNQIIEQKVTGVVFIPPAPTLIDSSNKMLEYAKGVLSWQLK
jgi:hypothetical protein